MDQYTEEDNLRKDSELSLQELVPSKKSTYEESYSDKMSFDDIKEDNVTNKIHDGIKQHKTQVFAICLPVDKI